GCWAAAMAATPAASARARNKIRPRISPSPLPVLCVTPFTLLSPGRGASKPAGEWFRRRPGEPAAAPFRACERWGQSDVLPRASDEVRVLGKLRPAAPGGNLK